MAINFLKVATAIVVFLTAGILAVSSSWLDFFKSNPNEPYATLEIYPKTSTNDGDLIWFEYKNQTTYEPYLVSLTNLLQGYNRSEKVEICDQQKYSEGIPCDINMKYFGPCGLDYSPYPTFGYNIGSPCVFLKIKLNNLKLQYYNYTDSLPAEMPERLKQEIKSMRYEEAKNLYITCEGADPASLENIGPTAFYPSNKISDKFLRNDVKGYVDPIIAMKIQKASIGILINIECRLWAKNIDPKKNVLQFGIMID